MTDKVTGAILADGFEGLFTRRQWLTRRALLDTGTDVWTAIEAVSTTAIEHPEWDMDEEKTWAEWEAR